MHPSSVLVPPPTVSYFLPSSFLLSSLINLPAPHRAPAGQPSSATHPFVLPWSPTRRDCDRLRVAAVLDTLFRSQCFVE